MNVHDLVTAAGLVGGDVGRAVPALVRVAVAATAMLADAEDSVPYYDAASDAVRKACATKALEEALRGLEALLGPLPLPPEPTP